MLLYGSSKELAQKTIMSALHHLRQITQEASQSCALYWGQQPIAPRALSQRLNRGFNEPLNGFTNEGWLMMGTEGMDHVTILVNSSPAKLKGLNLSFNNGISPVNNGLLCAKVSMLLQNIDTSSETEYRRECCTTK